MKRRSFLPYDRREPPGQTLAALTAGRAAQVFVNRLSEPARDNQRFAGDPLGIRRGKEERSGCNVLRFTGAAKWGLRFEHLPELAFGKPAGG